MAQRSGLIGIIRIIVLNRPSYKREERRGYVRGPERERYHFVKARMILADM
jgi:hypothetical protein